MLFDLKGKRKRLVQVVYLGLAILFGGGLVLFGVGGNVSGGLIDAFKGTGSANTSAFNDQVERAERQAAAKPREPAVWLAVLRAQFNLASSPEGSDAETGQLTDRGPAGDHRGRAGLGALSASEAREDRCERRSVCRPCLWGAPGLRQGRGDAGASR